LKQITQAKRYAKALLDLVGIENTPQALAEISAVNDLMAKSKEFKSLLSNPHFTLEEREKIIKQIADRLKISNNMIKFILNLTELKLILYLSAIIRIATSLYLDRKKRAKAVVITPIEMSKDHENELKSSLKKLTDRDVDVEYVIDPSLLGGVLVKIGSTMYDTSVIGQLRLLKNELIKG